MIDVWQKMYKICLHNSIKFKFSWGTALDHAGGLTVPPDPQLDCVPTNQVGLTGYFMAATALLKQLDACKLKTCKVLTLHGFSSKIIHTRDT